MSWVITATAGGAVLGAMNAAQQRKSQQQANQQSANISAAQMQYSPWTGVKPQNAQIGAVSANPMAGAVQGGLSGAMFAKQNGFGAPKDNSAEKLISDQKAAGGIGPLAEDEQAKLQQDLLNQKRGFQIG